MHSIEGALRMSDEINAQFGFERVFSKTNGNADTDTKITKFGISFNSDGTTTFYAELEKSSASQKEYLEKIQERIRTGGVQREELFVVSKVAAGHKTYEDKCRGFPVYDGKI